MALSSVDFKTTFQFNSKKFLLEDTTDYAGQSVSLTTVTGVFKIVDPTGGTHYNNINHASPDINPDVSLTNNLIALPLDASGNVLQGTYTITYTVRKTNATTASSTEVSETKTFNLSYTKPQAKVVMTVNCVKPLLKSDDQTNYTVKATAPTLSRTHTIQYPPSTGQADLVGTGKTVETATFFTVKNDTLQHSSTLSTTATWDFGGGWLVTDVITGSDQIDVACDAQLCDIFCCMQAEWQRYLNNRGGVNNTLAAQALANFGQMASISEHIRTALECSKEDDVSALTAEVLKIGNCTSGCDCDDGTPVLVSGLGGANATFVVDSGGSPVTVISNTVGNTTTYTVILDSAFVTKVNDSFNTTVAAGTNVTVSEVVDANGNKTYTINSSASGTSYLIHNDVTDDTETNNAAFTTIKSKTVAANTLASNGDKIKILTHLNYSGFAPGNTGFVQVHIDGAFYTAKIPSWSMGIVKENLKIEIDITRKDVNTAWIDTRSITSDSFTNANESRVFLEKAYNIGTFATPMAVEVKVQTSTGAETFTCSQLAIEYIAKQ